MSDRHISLADGGPDDLPRTVIRERENRKREARERERGPSLGPLTPTFDTGEPPQTYAYDEAPPATVTALRIPFVQLMLFFVKAVFAAVPALIILAILLWGAGQLLTTFYPALVKMQILIRFPG